MSYIIADKVQENMIESFRSILTEDQLKNTRFSFARKQAENYKNICNQVYLNPGEEDVIIAWYHLGHRFLRGII